jgi:hypothetical protein
MVIVYTVVLGRMIFLHMTYVVYQRIQLVTWHSRPVFVDYIYYRMIFISLPVMLKER